MAGSTQSGSAGGASGPASILVPAAGPRRSAQRSAVLHGGGQCALSCALCDCSGQPSTATEISRALEGGGARLVLRGSPESSASAALIIGQAREQGYSEVVVRTNAIAYMNPEAAAGLARLGADGVLVPLFSQIPSVHDKITGRPLSFLHALTGMKSLAKAGLSSEIEIPLLSPRLQNLEALVDQARKVVPSLRAVRLFLPNFNVPEPIAPPPWSVAAPALARVLEKCRELGIRTTLTAAEGVPLCGLKDYPDLHDLYRFNPKAKSSRWGLSVLGEACKTCVVKAQCPGIVASYHNVHGETDIVAYSQRPSLMYDQRTTRRREWTAEQRIAASKVDLLVLRPTVNCNQDCTFCSANETSNNVWTDSQEMYRQIARAAKRGVRRLSFSGGEPTLSRDLIKYVRAATRLGIGEIELVTNGTLLDNLTKVKALAEAGVSRAFVSLHAHDERLSRESTQKVGDFAKTVRAVKLLVEAGVITGLNHVITARNYPYLREFVEFVHREFGGGVKISFAFVTPQFKALDNLDVMPKLSEVMPYLKRAMYRALELGQIFSVGSRQGIPFCFLGEFQAWSDGLGLSNSAIAEDGPQKKRGEVCDTCKYGNYCTGLWKPYAAKYGFGELVPIKGRRLDDDQVAAIRAIPLPLPWGVPLSFGEVPEAVRDREAEALGPPLLDEAPALPPMMKLPMFVPQRTRPLRVAMLGTGKHARRVARNLLEVSGLSLDAVISPHAPESDLSDFGSCPAYRDPMEAIDGMRPEALLLVSSTETHLELARLAMAQGIPALLEKPITRTEEEGEELVREAAEKGAILMPAHNMLFAPGVDAVLAMQGPGVLSYVRRRPPSSNEIVRSWSRTALFETLYHALVLVGRGCGGGVGEVVRAQFRGDSVPERFRIELKYAQASAEVVLDFAAATEEDSLARRIEAAPEAVDATRPASDADAASASDATPLRELTWRRVGRAVTLTSGDKVTAVEVDGNDTQRMLANFRDVVLGKAQPGARLDEALDVMRTGRKILEALAAAGAPFERPNAPKHAHSRQFQQPFR